MSSMKIPKLKVRPRSLAQVAPCAAELSAMLACWAQHPGDKMSMGSCSQAALALEQCMATSAGAKKGKVRKPTINYHLARLGKNL